MAAFCLDRKSTRLNSSHLVISYGRFLLGSEEHTSELQSPCNLVCRLLLEKKKKQHCYAIITVRHVHDQHSSSVTCERAGMLAMPVTAGTCARIPYSLYLSSFFFFLMSGRPPSFPFFPSTPLFR